MMVMQATTISPRTRAYSSVSVPASSRIRRVIRLVFMAFPSLVALVHGFCATTLVGPALSQRPAEAIGRTSCFLCGRLRISGRRQSDRGLRSGLLHGEHGDT